MENLPSRPCACRFSRMFSICKDDSTHICTRLRTFSDVIRCLTSAAASYRIFKQQKMTGRIPRTIHFQKTRTCQMVLGAGVTIILPGDIEGAERQTSSTLRCRAGQAVMAAFVSIDRLDRRCSLEQFWYSEGIFRSICHRLRKCLIMMQSQSCAT